MIIADTDFMRFYSGVAAAAHPLEKKAPNSCKFCLKFVRSGGNVSIRSATSFIRRRHRFSRAFFFDGCATACAYNCVRIIDTIGFILRDLILRRLAVSTQHAKRRISELGFPFLSKSVAPVNALWFDTIFETPGGVLGFISWGDMFVSSSSSCSSRCCCCSTQVESYLSTEPYRCLANKLHSGIPLFVAVQLPKNRPRIPRFSLYSQTSISGPSISGTP